MYIYVCLCKYFILQSDTYDWDEQDKNMALSGYYWLSSISGFAGGYFSQKYGCKTILGYSQLLASVFSSLVPFLAPYGAVIVAYVRMIQGVFSVSAKLKFPVYVKLWKGNMCNFVHKK